mmetsp:Transcript_23167/g.54686  ORF Transcript_23167/g.54686 Transcript_23167/m.54686 type:complete len:142 (+) Transcript_23167:223-648(+)
MVRISRSFVFASLGVCLVRCGSSMPINTSEDIRRKFAAESHSGDVTREDILENRTRRKRLLNVMLMDARQKLADHSAGEKLLTEEQKSELETNVDLFQQKIDSMEVELEEWEIERLIVREQKTADRRRERSRDSRRLQSEL